MISFLLVTLAAVLVFSMSARGEKVRAGLLALVVLILSNASWLEGTRSFLLSAMESVGGHLG